jgi:glutamate racemase
VIGVVEPGARRAVEVTRNGQIGVIGTMRTIASQAYRKALLRIDSTLVVHETACPLFVPLIEEGWLDHTVTRLVVREYLDPLLARGIDTLVLGCTHYPLIAQLIGECYPELVLVDSASSTPGKLSLYLSDYSDAFVRLGETILDRPVHDVLFPVSLEELEVGVS